MNNLQITDNKQKNLYQINGTQEDYNNLLHIGNTPIETLINENPSLLVFPHSIYDNFDKSYDQYIFSIYGNHDNLKKVTLSTGNIMGFVGYGDTQISIRSRFQKEDNQPDLFLHYMIQKVFLPNIFDLPHSIGDEDSLDFLLYLFPLYLKNALSQGLYKTYQKFERNDARIKGVIDIPRHIRQNIPFAGKVAYTSRESSYDNDITELIRHTIEYIKTKNYGKAILSYDNDTKGYVSQIIEATPLYSAQNRQKIINKNIKPFHHPFYLAYKPLQKLCMMILCHKKLKYAISEKTVYGILFDGAWLWEEYLATILTKCGFIHPRNKDGENSITIYKGNPRYPDFYKGKQQKSTTIIPNENYILDAKYKHLDDTNINLDDLHQLVTYMHILPAKAGGLIYPYDKECPNNDIQISDEKTLYGLGGTIKTFGIPIPQNASSYNDFVLSMKNTEDNLQKIFSSIK